MNVHIIGRVGMPGEDMRLSFTKAVTLHQHLCVASIDAAAAVIETDIIHTSTVATFVASASMVIVIVNVKLKCAPKKRVLTYPLKLME